MSSLRPKQDRERIVDVTAWVLGSAIVVLATLDLVVWASMQHVPNPISKLVTEQSATSSTPAGQQASRPTGGAR